MAFIHPNTVIHILRNVPLDNTYRDTLTFGNASSSEADILSAQIAYFTSKAKYTFSTENFTYQRATKAIKTHINAESLWDCNYIMFQNSDHGTKWFYAFIDRVEYINDHMSEIYFELDVMQTWYTNYKLQHCFVAREHVNDDTVGVNIIDEGLEIGEFITRDTYTFDELDDPANYCVVIAATLKPSPEPEGGFVPTGASRYDYVWNGLAYQAFSTSDIGGLSTHLDAMATAGKEAAVVCMFMYPIAFIDGFTSGMVLDTTYPTEIIHSTFINNEDLDGYVPKNNKMFIYPYNFIGISNMNGNGAVLRYELFDSVPGTGNCGIKLTCNLSPASKMLCYPMNYKGQTNNIDEAVSLGGFPLCAWSYDVFKNWLAQNRYSVDIGIAASRNTMMVGAATGNPVAVSAGVIGMAQEIGSIAQHYIMPPQAQGNVGAECSTFSLGLLNFRIMRQTIRASYAKRIDDFFSMYGYKIGAVKKPNVFGRTSWNYVKTGDCNATGSIPFNDLSKIRHIYDKGITFWHGDYVGDYSRNNSIV